MPELKPYIVGGHDMVAAESPEQARQLLIDQTGYDPDEYDNDSAEDVSEWLDEMIYDEAGVRVNTLRQFIEDCNGVPQYLYGWE